MEAASLPAGPFACVAADPPWRFATYGGKRAVPSRGEADPYETMPLDAIKALPVAASAERDAHLFLWATGPCLRQAFDVMDAWGFAYSGLAFTWVKLRRAYNPLQLRMLPTAEADLFVGLGYTTRKNSEMCLLGRRGKPKRQAADVREVILAPVREHSRKPEEARARMERYCAGPRLEMFARERAPGWTAWGNQTDKFGEAP